MCVNKQHNNILTFNERNKYAKMKTWVIKHFLLFSCTHSGWQTSLLARGSAHPHCNTAPSCNYKEVLLLHRVACVQFLSQTKLYNSLLVAFFSQDDDKLAGDVPVNQNTGWNKLALKSSGSHINNSMCTLKTCRNVCQCLIRPINADKLILKMHEF